MVYFLATRGNGLHRSFFCRAFAFTSLLRRLTAITFEFQANQGRIETLRNSSHAFERHFSEHDRLLDTGPQLGGGRQKEDVRETYAVHRRDKGYGDAMTHHPDVFEMFHDLDQAHDSPKNP